MRINKYIAQSGVASRRVADELIMRGKVRVNGAVLAMPGYDVQEGDEISVDGKIISGKEKSVYYAMNKPVGFITTTSDERGRPTVLDLIQDDINARIFPVGRLDCRTSGLLIMTNDGQLAQHLTHPSKKVFKCYHAAVDGAVTREQLWALRNGVDIGGYITKPAEVNILSSGPHNSVLEIKISEGKNRQVRLMCKAVGHNVTELERVAIGNIQLGHLKPGQYRKLSPSEVEYLKNC